MQVRLRNPPRDLGGYEFRTFVNRQLEVGQARCYGGADAFSGGTARADRSCGR
jgi:hypothetical protein